MHQTVFFGYGMLVTLGTALLLGRERKLYLPHLMTSLALILGGAAVASGLLGIALSGQLAAVSMGAIFGGATFGIATVPYFFAKEDVNSAFDVLVSATILGLLATRVGCFYNGCDYGSPTDWLWGVTVEVGHRAVYSVHPFPWMVIVPTCFVFVFRWLIRRPGTIAVHLTASYLIIRFVAEFFRDAMTVREVGPLNINQWMAIAAFVGVVAFFRPFLKRYDER